MTTALAPPTETQLSQEIAALQAEAAAIVVRDEATQAAAWEFSTRLKAHLAAVDAAFDPTIAAAHKAHKEALAAKKRYCNVPETLMRSVNAKIATYQADQRRVREAEERRLSDLARKQAEERQLEVALDLERQGRIDESANVLATPVAPLAVQLPPVAKPQGARMRTDWKFRITDPAALPREYLVPDEVKIGGVVRALKSATSIPGVEVHSIETVF